MNKVNKIDVMWDAAILMMAVAVSVSIFIGSLS